MHRALHDIGALCRAREDLRRHNRVASATDVVVAFARRNPRATFAVDDEHATTVGVLLVAERALRTCDPPSATRVQQLLPSDYQSSR